MLIYYFLMINLLHRRKFVPRSPMSLRFAALITLHPVLFSQQTVQQLLARHSKFLDLCQETKTVSFLAAVCQLSHANSDLASHSWTELFPRIWKVLSDKQQQNLAGELIPFLCSGSHVVQKDVQPSACKVCIHSV